MSKPRARFVGLAASLFLSLSLSAPVSASGSPVVVEQHESATQTPMNPAQITDESRTGRVVTLTISTPAFTVPTHVAVDLPVDYDAQTARRWPVTYVLAGTMNTYESFNSFVGGVTLTEDFPSIVVSPNGDSGYWSDWFNDGSGGPPMYETYVIDQLLPLIDAHFRTIPTRSQRAIMGISMGGYGAAMLAAEHPDLFAYAATLSGAVDSNLPTLGAALTASPMFQGGSPDAIYGPRATQEVRWRGHNPTDLANNLRGLELQVRSANGIPNPGIGEDPASADTVSCVVEGGVHMGTVNFHNALAALQIPHLYLDYGAGCHTAANFQREISDTIKVFAKQFAHPTSAPTTFDFLSIQPSFEVYGWRVVTDPKRALEFFTLTSVNARGLMATGSGSATITSPALFKGIPRVQLTGARQISVVPDAKGRITFAVDLGAADTSQQYTLGTSGPQSHQSVTFTRVRSAMSSSKPAATHQDSRDGTGRALSRLAATGISDAVPLTGLGVLLIGVAALQVGRRRRA